MSLRRNNCILPALTKKLHKNHFEVLIVAAYAAPAGIAALAFEHHVAGGDNNE